MSQIPQTQASPAEGSEPADVPPSGYPKLAGLMAASAPAAIFRKFGELQMINLLRLQARLQDLEQEYRDIRTEDLASDEPGLASLVKDFRQMQDMAESEDGESEQYDVLKKIQVALKEYNEALFQVMRLDQAEGPSSRDVGDLRKWLIRPSMGNNFLVGAEALTWDEVNNGDFISPRVGTPDKFNSLLTGSILDAYHWAYGHRKELSQDLSMLIVCRTNADQHQNQDSRIQDLGKNLRVYDDKKITVVADALAAVISSLLPTVMILVLFFVHDMLWRLGLLIIFTAIFSASITVFTNAKKIEVYSATAAFAAVEVVFIGSTSSTG